MWTGYGESEGSVKSIRYNCEIKKLEKQENWKNQRRIEKEVYIDK